MGKDNQENAIEKYFVNLVAKETNVSIDEINIDDTFHALGFDSISAVFFMEKIENEYKVTLSPLCFWDYPTIRSLSGYVQSLM